MICLNCIAPNDDGAQNCKQCGAKMTEAAPPMQRHHRHPAQLTWMLKVREHYSINITCSARYGGAGDFDIVANGFNQGKLKTGKTVTVTVNEPEVELVIKGWGINPLKTKLKLGENAYAEVGVWKKNVIFYGIVGAEVL